MATYIQPKHATLTALQNNITHVTIYIQTEIYNSEINSQGDVNVNEELYYHSSYTGYTFQRKCTIYKCDSRRTFLLHSKAI